MTRPRILTIAAFLIAGLAVSAPASACGYGSGAEIGSNSCTGGATSGDRAAMNDIRAAMAAQRAMSQQ
jgi:hypothetical protein